MLLLLSLLLLSSVVLFLTLSLAVLFLTLSLVFVSRLSLWFLCLLFVVLGAAGRPVGFIFVLCCVRCCHGAASAAAFVASVIGGGGGTSGGEISNVSIGGMVTGN